MPPTGTVSSGIRIVISPIEFAVAVTATATMAAACTNDRFTDICSPSPWCEAEALDARFGDWRVGRADCLHLPEQRLGRNDLSAHRSQKRSEERSVGKECR